MKTAELLYQCLMSEFHNNADAALQHLADRFVAECDLVEYVRRGSSPGYLRAVPATTGKIDDVPNPISDEWIATGVDA